MINISSPASKMLRTSQRTPFKILRNAGESFLDLYDDTNFDHLEIQEIISKLERNLKSFKNLEDKANNRINEVKDQLKDIEETKKSYDVNKKNERELNEELDMLMTRLYDIQVKNKSLETIIRQLGNVNKSKEEEKISNIKIEQYERELTMSRELIKEKDFEIIKEKNKIKQINNLKDELENIINEVIFYCEYRNQSLL